MNFCKWLCHNNAHVLATWKFDGQIINCILIFEYFHEAVGVIRSGVMISFVRKTLTCEGTDLVVKLL